MRLGQRSAGLLPVLVHVGEIGLLCKKNEAKFVKFRAFYMDEIFQVRLLTGKTNAEITNKQMWPRILLKKVSMKGFLFFSFICISLVNFTLSIINNRIRC